MNEILLLQGLSHPNLVEIMEVHESKNSIYIIMENLTGGDLFDSSGQDGPIVIAADEIKQVTLGMLHSIKYLAENGVMHRDIKAENILLASKSKPITANMVRLCDFGLATLAKTEDPLYFRCGTPGYVAPEVLKWEKGDKLYNEICDVFSVGVIFFTMLCGKMPFDGDFKTTLKKNRLCNVDYEMLQNCPVEAVDLARGLLEEDPTKRLTPAQAIEHKFFSSVSTYNPVPIKVKGVKAPKGENYDSIGSFYVNKPAMNGQNDSVRGSTNSMANSNVAGSIQSIDHRSKVGGGGQKSANQSENMRINLLKKSLMKEDKLSMTSGQSKGLKKNH
jgi:serine/threonine protein kinase